MSQTITRLYSAPRPSTGWELVASVWQAVRAARQAGQTRRQLGTLDDRALSDIGVSRAQAQFLAETPVWDVLR